MGDLDTMDPSAYAEPMELYDSIFWGEFMLIALMFPYFKTDKVSRRVPRSVELWCRCHEL